MKYPEIRNYIGGAFAPAELPGIDVFDPSAGTVISRVPMSGVNELNAAVTAAKRAFPAWSAMPIKQRVQVFFRYKTLLEKHIDELAALISEENGKILAKPPRAIFMRETEFSAGDEPVIKASGAPARLWELRQYNDGPWTE